jgi:hypothetical protein
VNIRRCTFGDSGDPLFDEVEDRTRFIEGDIIELAIECRRAHPLKDFSTARAERNDARTWGSMRTAADQACAFENRSNKGDEKRDLP